MTQEHKPPVEPPLSQDARDLGRALGDQYALNEAEKRAAERGEEFMPGVDEGRRVATAFRELKAHLKFKAEQRRQEEELAGNGGKPLLRQRDIVPPISPQSESPSTETPRAPITTLLADTETLLNALIAECHFLLREVAFRTMCDSKDPGRPAALPRRHDGDDPRRCDRRRFRRAAAPWRDQTDPPELRP